MPTNSPTIDLDDAAAGGGAGTGGPSDDFLEHAAGQMAATTVGAPDLTPPGETAVSSGDGAVGAAVWHRDVRITAMWSNAATRNAYAAVSGLGWRKISPANDSCFVTMTALLSHAEVSGRRTDVKLDGNTIVEVYVF